MARMGAKHLVVLARSGYSDEKSKLILKNLHAEGCQVNLVTGDVSVLEDVRRTFKAASVKIGGVIQGAMVLKVSFHLPPKFHVTHHFRINFSLR